MYLDIFCILCVFPTLNSLPTGTGDPVSLMIGSATKIVPISMLTEKLDGMTYPATANKDLSAQNVMYFYSLCDLESNTTSLYVFHNSQNNYVF